MFKEAMQAIIDHRGGKLRVPGLETWGYTFYITVDVWEDALTNGYTDADGNVTSKFREEYVDMFDRIGKIK
jgi:hypothetical protein